MVACVAKRPPSWLTCKSSNRTHQVILCKAAFYTLSPSLYCCTELFHPCSSAVVFTELVSPSLQPVRILLKDRSPLQFQSSFSNPAKLCFLNFIPMCLGNVSVFLQSSWTPLTYTIFWIRSEEFLIQEASGKGWIYFSCSQIWAIVYWMFCIIYGIRCRLRKPRTFLQGKQILRNSFQHLN